MMTDSPFPASAEGGSLSPENQPAEITAPTAPHTAPQQPDIFERLSRLCSELSTRLTKLDSRVEELEKQSNATAPTSAAPTPTSPAPDSPAPTAPGEDPQACPAEPAATDAPAPQQSEDETSEAARRLDFLQRKYDDVCQRCEELAASNQQLRSERDADARRIEALRAEHDESQQAAQEAAARLDRALADSNSVRECVRQLEDECRAKDEQLQAKDQLLESREQQLQAHERQLQESQVQYENCRADRDEAHRQLAACDAELRQAKEESLRLQREADTLRAESARLAQDRDAARRESGELSAQVQRLQEELRRAEEQEQQLNADLSAARQKGRELQDALTQAQAQAADVKKQLDSLSILRGRLWPACLRVGALESFAEEWHRQLDMPSADPTLLSMFANIFSWSCAKELALREGADDAILEQTATSALYSFSKFLFDWLYRAGKSAEEVEQISFALAAEINDELEKANAGYRIGDDEVAIGDSYSSKTMVPSPQGAPVGSVASLQAWCIKNKSGSVCLKKALVCLS